MGRKPKTEIVCAILKETRSSSCLTNLSKFYQVIIRKVEQKLFNTTQLVIQLYSTREVYEVEADKMEDLRIEFAREFIIFLINFILFLFNSVKSHFPSKVSPSPFFNEKDSQDNEIGNLIRIPRKINNRDLISHKNRLVLPVAPRESSSHLL